MSLVTAIIPTYNRASLLPRAIRSVLAQTHRPIELIVVDDGSSDDTEAVVATFAKASTFAEATVDESVAGAAFADPAIRYIRHPRNQGQCAALNTGILAATGEFVCFLDSDDEWRPEMIAKQLEVFAKHDSRMGVVYAHGGAYKADAPLTPSNVSYLEGPIYRAALAQGHVAHSIAMLVRRSCFDKVGMFDTRFSCFQDDDICFRLAKEYEFGLVREVLAVVHVNADNRLTADRRPYARGWHDLLRKHEPEILRECGPVVMGKHWFRAGLLFLDAGQRRAALSAFARAFRLAPSFKALGGIPVSVAPFPKLWLTLYRARRLD